MLRTQTHTNLQFALHKIGSVESMNAHSIGSTVLSRAALLLLLFASANATAAITLRAVATPSNAAPGERVRYAVTVSNSGSLQSVTLTGTVPVGTTVAAGELSLGAACDGVGFTTCAGGHTLRFGFNVAAGASVTVVYPALISTSAPPATGTALKSTATATVGTIKLQSSASATANSSAASLLHVTASGLPAQARAGGTVSYTLTFGNPGSAAVAANLSFPLPVGTTFVSASDGGTSSAGTVTWSLGTVAAGTAGRRTVVVQVVTTAVAGSQLASDAATALHSVLLTATVPPNTTVRASELSLGAACDGAGFTTCAAGQTLRFGFNVAAGASVTVVYPALISTSAPPSNGTLLNSDVWVEDTSLGNEYQLNVAAIASSTALAGLHVTASALPAQARAGGTVSYTLTFGNPGSTAVAANLSFPLPVGTTFVSASDGGTSSAGTVAWSLGTVAAGTAGRRTVVVQVATTAVAGSQLAADAALRNPTTQVVLAHAGLTTGVGNATQTVLNMRAVATPDPAAPGQRVRYAVTVSNTATALHSVLLTATVPANTTVPASELSLGAACDGAGFTTCAAGQTLRFGFNVAAGASVTVVYPALISTSAPPSNGTLLNADVWVEDTSLGNEYQLNVAAIASSTALAGLHVTASALPAQARAGGTVSYTLTFGNPGSTAVAANLSFPLPVGTTFVSASNGGTSSAGTVTWSLGTVAAGTAGRRTVVVQVATTAVAGSQLAADAALRNPTTQVVLAHAGLTTGVGNATETVLNVRAVATPDPAAPGQRVRYAVTVSNTATALHSVLLTATVPANTTVAANELSLGAACDGAGFTTCAAGQTLRFGFNVAAGASVTVVYPALISTSAPPSNGTLLNSDVWVEDTSLGNEYQLNVAAIASSTALAGLHVTASALPAQARAGGTVSYTLTFGNPGSTAVAANLSFPLPVGTTFVSASNGGTSSAG